MRMDSETKIKNSGFGKKKLEKNEIGTAGNSLLGDFVGVNGRRKMEKIILRLSLLVNCLEIESGVATQTRLQGK